MKRPRDEDPPLLESEDEEPLPKSTRTQEAAILQDLEQSLTKNNSNSLNQQLLETQKHYFTMYMEKLLHELPMGEAIMDAVRKNGHADDFVYMYTASKTIIQSMMSVKQYKAMKSIVDMFSGIMCRYVHDKVVTPMLKPVVQDEQLKEAYLAYQTSVQKEENNTELEMRCLLHTIYQNMEEDQQTVQLSSPFQTQLTQQMKAVSDYVVMLLFSISSKPVAQIEKAAEKSFADKVKSSSASEFPKVIKAPMVPPPPELPTPMPEPV